MNWVPPMLAVLAISAISLIGVFTLGMRPAILKRGLLVVVSFAAGALLGDAFLHLLPEAVEELGGFTMTLSLGVLAGILGFFILEKVLHWHHAHIATEEVLHPVAFTNLLGDALHNLVDGALVAGAFVASPQLGMATAIAVALHEIPQEIGDYGILVHSGMTPRRALAVNFLTALAAVLGAALALIAASFIEGIEVVLIAVTAGGFVYVASTDLIPELHKEPEAGKSFVQLVAMLSGVAVMSGLLFLE